MSTKQAIIKSPRRSTRVRSLPSTSDQATPLSIATTVDASLKQSTKTRKGSASFSETSAGSGLSVLAESPAGLHKVATTKKRVRSSGSGDSAPDDTVNRPAKSARIASKPSKAPPSTRCSKAGKKQDIAQELKWYSDLLGEPLSIVSSTTNSSRSDLCAKSTSTPSPNLDGDDAAAEGDDEADDDCEVKSSTAAETSKGNRQRKSGSSTRFEKDVDRTIQKLALAATRAVRKPNGEVETMDIINWLVERQYGGTRWMGPNQLEGETYQQAMSRQFINSSEMRDAIKAEKLERDRQLSRLQRSRERFKPRSHYAKKDQQQVQTPTSDADVDADDADAATTPSYDSCTSTLPNSKSSSSEEDTMT